MFMPGGATCPEAESAGPGRRAGKQQIASSLRGVWWMDSAARSRPGGGGVAVNGTPYRPSCRGLYTLAFIY